MANRMLSLFVVYLFTMLGLSAQNSFDALRYSNFQVGGTARSIGSGGALGALGADFSVLSTNPAGMGWYRRGEFVLSPTFYNARTTSTLTNDPDGFATKESRNNFNFNALGVVVAGNPRSPDWPTFNFGIGINRLANFHQEFIYEGVSEGSIILAHQEQANGPNGISDFESGVSIDAQALYDLEPQDGFYESDMELAPEAPIFRRQDVISRGSINELVFSFAGNYKERILLGATIGVPFLRYEEDKTYREEDQGAGDGDVPLFDDLEYTEELNTTGTGINLKVGMIFRAHQALRLGLAVHTPTAFRMEDAFRTSMAYNFTYPDGEVVNGFAESPDGLFEYRLRTPWRVIGSGGLIVKKNGFLSAEVEYVNYGNNEFRYDGFIDAERDVNNSIANDFEPAMNIRLGGEIAYEIFRFRAGLGIQQSPFANDDTTNKTYSAGFGIREKNFSLDFAYRLRQNEELFIPYQAFESPEQLVINEGSFNTFAFTLGFRF
ncbi:MAG: hypothetical protein J5I94_13150 [Phaeodactylibacter sp.]|nr:hypothetical protein [Phaeodactylibacter sp.]